MQTLQSYFRLLVANRLVADTASFSLVLSSDADQGRLDKAVALFRRAASQQQTDRPQVHVSVHLTNDFEYQGLLRVSEVARQFPNDVVAYGHAKGMTRKAAFFGLSYFLAVFQPWKSVLQLFEACPSVEKVGYLCSEKGWLWHTLFYMRSSHASRLAPVVKSSDRYSFERWSGSDGKGQFDAKSCFSLHVLQSARTFSADFRYRFRTLNHFSGVRQDESGVCSAKMPNIREGLRAEQME